MNPARADATACGPSTAKDSASRGTGTTVADQTVRESPPATPEARDTTLPMPQESAPSRHSARAARLTCPPRPSATTTSPAEPSRTPATWVRVGRSRSAPAAITTVKITCACRTSAARPGGIPAAMET
ncbi:hypothetical protein GCM10027601_24400 [Nocardioides ungokensis]